MWKCYAFRLYVYCEMIEFNEREALRYLKADKDDKAAQILVDTVYLKLRNDAGSLLR